MTMKINNYGLFENVMNIETGHALASNQHSRKELKLKVIKLLLDLMKIQ